MTRLEHLANVYSHRLCSILVLVAVWGASIGAAACARSSIRTPELVSFVGTQQAIPAEGRDWYRTGTYRYNGGARRDLCTFTARDSTEAIVFTCGMVELVLKPGVPVEAVDDLIAMLSGTVKRLFQGSRLYVSIRVPARTERAAILRAFDDSRVSSAGLDLARRGVL